MGKYAMGRKRDHFDPRDLALTLNSHLLPGPMPASFDADASIATKLPAIFDQGQEGSCTANAGIRFMYSLSLKFPQYTAPFTALSRQAQYWWERALPTNNDTDQDNGANTRDIFIVLNKIGACPESDDPYSPSSLYTDPGEQARLNASQRRIGAYHRIVSLDDMKGCLLSGYSFTIGLLLYESFEDVRKDGVYDPDVTREQVIGGHEVYCHGYDDRQQTLLLDNSWGYGWGKDGQFTIPYAHILDYNSSQWDAWTGHFGPPWKG